MTQRFFDYMKDNYDLSLLHSEACEIILEALEAHREIVKVLKKENEEMFLKDIELGYQSIIPTADLTLRPDSDYPDKEITNQ